MTYAEKAKLW